MGKKRIFVGLLSYFCVYAKSMSCVQEERGVNGHSTERERWTHSEREESPHRLSGGFSRDGCRLSMQYLGDGPGYVQIYNEM